MTEPVRWTCELTRDDLPRLASGLEWALQHQNQRFAHAMPTSRLPVRTRQLLVVAISLFGFGAVFVLRALDGISPSWFAAAIAIYSVGLVFGLLLPWVRTRGRAFAGRRLAARAARILAPLGGIVPATFEYALEDGRIAVACAQLPRLRPLDSRAVGLVIAVGPSLFAFRRPRSLIPSRTLHVPDEATRAAVLATFGTAERVELSGPIDGYGDRIPRATVASA
jgi:hypothetical protein